MECTRIFLERLFIYRKNINMEYLTILDFNTGEVHIYPVQFEQEPDMDELLESLGHRANDCQWMFSNGNIKIHNDILKDGELK